MALPTAIFAMVASMGFAGVAVISSVNAQRGTDRDHDSKSAIAAADAGADVALMRINRFQGSLSATNRCVGPAGESQLESSTGWCPPTTMESVGDGAYTYQVSAYQPGGELRVVSTGQADGVSRRIEVGLVSYNGEEVFADERLIGQDKVTLEGTADVRVDVGTNGDIEANSNSTLCGDVRHGIGKTAAPPDCGKKVLEGNKDLPPIVLPEGITTNNWNCRLSVTCLDPLTKKVDTSMKDPYVGSNGKEKRTDTEPYDATNRIIDIDGNSTLTMGGGDYFICGLFMQNGQLIMAGGPGVQVRIFFDTPENCGFEDGDVQIQVSGGNIKSTGYNPKEGMFNVPGFYVLGSTSITTQVDLGGNSGTNELILYAPYSDVAIGGNATWIGMMAGKTIRLHGTPEITSDAGIDTPDIYFTSLWEPTRYVECTGATASPPDASC